MRCQAWVAVGILSQTLACGGSDGADVPATQGAESTSGAAPATVGSDASSPAMARAGSTSQPSGKLPVIGTSMMTSTTSTTATAGSPGSANHSSGAAGTDGSAANGAAGSAGTMTAGAKDMGAAGAMMPVTDPSTDGDCDRACLMDVMDRYLAAVIAHDPSTLALGSSLRMTENGVEAKPGDGIWQTATALHDDMRLDYADPVSHNVGTQCLMDEGSSPVMYEVRLKVDAGEITEIETMTVRQADAANGFFDPDNLKPEPVFLQMPAEGERMSREELISVTELYIDYLEGTKGGSDLPFDEMCKRYENGVITASGLGAFQGQSWFFDVKPRRILIVDEESQITWGMLPFFQGEDTLVVGEAFKMLGGKIMMIQAIMAYMKNGYWD